MLIFSCSTFLLCPMNIKKITHTNEQKNCLFWFSIYLWNNHMLAVAQSFITLQLPVGCSITDMNGYFIFLVRHTNSQNCIRERPGLCDTCCFHWFPLYSSKGILRLQQHLCQDMNVYFNVISDYLWSTGPFLRITIRERNLREHSLSIKIAL